MTVVCYEMLDSMSGSITNDLSQGETREVNKRYLIGQCAGFNDAVSSIEAYAPQYVESDGAGIFWRRAKLTVNAIGNKYFDCTSTYATLVFKQSGDESEDPQDTRNYVPGSLAWDTTGHTEHRTQSRGQACFPDGGPDFDRAINVSGESVNGIDVIVPSLKYSETWIMPVQVAINSAYVGAVYERTGTVNLNQFRAFKPGEALFMGARGQWTDDQPYVAITYDFECRPNVSDYSVSAGIPTFSKEGWQYVWVMYETAPSAGSLVRRPLYAYRETIYEKKDWSPLKIVDKPIAGPPAVNRPFGAAAPQGGLAP
jgi:hypothetical protein